MSEAPTVADFLTPPTLPVFDFTWPAAAEAQPLARPAVDGRLLMVGGLAVAALVLLTLPPPPARGRRR